MPVRKNRIARKRVSVLRFARFETRIYWASNDYHVLVLSFPLSLLSFVTRVTELYNSTTGIVSGLRDARFDLENAFAGAPGDFRGQQATRNTSVGIVVFDTGSETKRVWVWRYSNPSRILQRGSHPSTHSGENIQNEAYSSETLDYVLINSRNTTCIICRSAFTDLYFSTW